MSVGCLIALLGGALLSLCAGMCIGATGLTVWERCSYAVGAVLGFYVIAMGLAAFVRFDQSEKPLHPIDVVVTFLGFGILLIATILFLVVI